VVSLGCALLLSFLPVTAFPAVAADQTPTGTIKVTPGAPAPTTPTATPPAAPQTAAPASPTSQPAQPATVTPPATPPRPVTRKPVRPGKKPETPLGLFPLEVVWRQPLAAPPSVWPAYDQTTAYIPLKTKALVAVSLKDGVARWTLDDVTVTAPPITDSTRLYLVGDGTLEARHTANGESIWRVPTTGEVSAPLVAESGWLIVALDNGDLKALKGETGEVVWELALGGVVRTEPLIVGDRLYIAPEGSLLMALDLLTGKTIWERDLGSKAISIAAHGDRICAGTVSRMFFGIDERRGDIKWRWRIGGDVIGRPAFSDDMVFVITLSNEMRGFKLNDGGQKWRQPLDFRALGGPTRIGDVLLVPSYSPTMRGYNTKDGKRAGVYSLPISERSSPAAPPMVILRETFIDDLIVTATADGELIATRRVTAPPIVPLSTLPGLGAAPITLPGAETTPTAAPGVPATATPPATTTPTPAAASAKPPKPVS
jgi:outer membrane protein assembly factor BamB